MFSLGRFDLYSIDGGNIFLESTCLSWFFIVFGFVKSCL